MFRAFILAVFLALYFTTPAFAYIDPGSASLALQALIAVIAGAGFFLQTKLAGFLGWVRGKKKADLQDVQPLSLDNQHNSNDQSQ